MESHPMCMDWRIIIVKMSILRKAIYRLNTIPTEYQWHSSQKKKKNPKICKETKKTLIAKAVLRKKCEGGSITITSKYTTKL